MWARHPGAMPRVLAVVALLSCWGAAAAQVNTERLRTALDDDGVAATLDASTAFATGNTEFLQIGLGGRVDTQLGSDAAFLVGRFDFARTDGASFVDKSFAHARYTAAVTGRLATEGFLQIERNRQQRLQSRRLLGAGVRLTLADADSASLAVGLTPMLEVEVLDEALGGTQSAVVRLSSYLSGRLALGPRTSASAVVYVQPRADAVGDVRVLGQAALDVGLTRAIALRTRLNVRHDARPPAEVERTDLTIENGLVLTLPVP